MEKKKRNNEMKLKSLPVQKFKKKKKKKNSK